MENNRRNFLKQLSTMGVSAALVTASPLLAAAEEVTGNRSINMGDKPFTISILQTTDVHCQVHPHDELFWENEKAVFRKTGGYAHLSTYFKKERKKNPNTFLIDTGDMFQGSELSVKTTGKVYLAANSPVTPTPPMAAKILDAPQTLLTQVTGVDYKFT